MRKSDGKIRWENKILKEPDKEDMRSRFKILTNSRVICNSCLDLR